MQLPIDRLIAIDRERAVAGRQLRIAVIGDSIVDVYVHGHFADGCQDGCPKFVEDSRVIVPGGAENAVRQLAMWPGVAVCDLTNGISWGSYISKERFLIDNKIIFRNDKEMIYCEDILIKKRELAIKTLRDDGQIDAVLISDYDKGFMTDSMIREIIVLCNERTVPVIADAKREPEIYHGAILKCNYAYAQKKQWINCSGKAVITYGAYSPEICNFNYPISLTKNRAKCMPPVPCVNHVGAGDCFAANLALALAHGLPLEDAAAVAHSAGRVYVQHPHNRPPWPHEVRRDCYLGSSEACEPCLGKVIQSEYLSDLHALRQSVAPGKLVFTNGVFRVPHAGHAWLMSWAKAQAGNGTGGVLAVGVNDDVSAAREKSGEYVLPLAERIEYLAGLAAVDWVIPFGTKFDAGQIVASLKPDTIVKGHEYAGGRVPGDEVCADVRFAPPGPFAGRHATELIKEIRG